MKTSTRIFVLLIFFGLGFVGIWHHEIWLDEAHHFLLGRDSTSFFDLYYNARYEGHPLLWNALLFILTFFTKKIFAMQLLHLLIATTNIFLILWYAPFPKHQKLLLTFSYFIFYEYSIISRNYALSLLFLLISVILYSKENKNYVLIFLCLSLLANIHLFSFFFSIFFFLLVLSDEKERRSIFVQPGFIASMIFFVLAIIFSAIQIKVPSDHFLFNFDSDKLLSFKRIGKTFSICWKGLFHFPDATLYNCWNTNWLVNYSKKIAGCLSLLAWLVPFFILKGNRKTVLLFYTTALAVAFFIYVSPIIVAVRHCGFLFLLLLTCYWIKQSKYKVNTNGMQYSSLIFSFILIPSCIASVLMYVHDYQFAFSTGGRATMFIENNNGVFNFPVIAQNTSVPVYSAYSGKKAIDVNTLKPTSFCNWNEDPFVIPKDDFVLRARKYLIDNTLGSAILLCQDSLNTEKNYDFVKIKLLQRFDDAIVKPECYKIYRIDIINTE
jgi:hypothetical protein